MTEQEWLGCDKPHPMLTYLRGRASNRKLRLYACASCRRVWPLLQDERSRKVVEVAEQYADGLTSYPELKGAQEQAREAWHALARVHRGAAWGTPGMWTMRAAAQAAAAAGREAWRAAWEVADEYQGGHPDTLRDIIGPLPFRAVSIDPSLLMWNGGTIRKLAQAIYDERAFDQLPILADALEESGFADQEVLGHLRGRGHHARGCWVIDLVLGKG